ncbi:universal stress protein [Streptomyces sp. NPDC048650]|uniref:universal stress protein n=1 Tax=unclassified Streptomyces TaxID=2593676 RepID=UPI0037140DEA
MNDTATTGRPVLVGIGEGPDQGELVRHAALHAGRHHSPLHLLHVADRPEAEGTLPDDGDTSGPSTGGSVLDGLVALVRSEFPDLPVTAETAPGRAAEELLRRSSRSAALVLGHRGTGGSPRLPLGSVSWEVAAHADCPVLVIRPGETPADPENRVVAGVDISDVSEEALDLAFTEAELRGAHLEILHATFHPGELPAGPGLVAPDHQALDESALLILEAETAERRTRFPRVHVHSRVERIRPGTLLRDASRHASLLVVGSHGRSGLRRLMLGSVSGEALHTSGCPVAVVPSGRTS